MPSFKASWNILPDPSLFIHCFVDYAFSLVKKHFVLRIHCAEQLQLWLGLWVPADWENGWDPWLASFILVSWGKTKKSSHRYRENLIGLCQLSFVQFDWLKIDHWSKYSSIHVENLGYSSLKFNLSKRSHIWISHSDWYRKKKDNFKTLIPVSCKVKCELNLWLRQIIKDQ